MVRNGKNRDLHLQEIKYYPQSDNGKYIYYDIGFYLVISYIHIIYTHVWTITLQNKYLSLKNKYLSIRCGNVELESIILTNDLLYTIIYSHV